jgi:hypothetical protein
MSAGSSPHASPGLANSRIFSGSLNLRVRGRGVFRSDTGNWNLPAEMRPHEHISGRRLKVGTTVQHCVDIAIASRILGIHATWLSHPRSCPNELGSFFLRPSAPLPAFSHPTTTIDNALDPEALIRSGSFFVGIQATLRPFCILRSKQAMNANPRPRR